MSWTSPRRSGLMVGAVVVVLVVVVLALGLGDSAPSLVRGASAGLRVVFGTLPPTATHG